MKVKEYFTDKELACPCGCGLMPDQKSIERLYAFRMIKGKPVIVTSAARCKAYNKQIGGADNSAHLTGAFDIKSNPEDEWEDIKIAQAVGFNGIGINDNVFLHLDDKHPEPKVWGY